MSHEDDHEEWLDDHEKGIDEEEPEEEKEKTDKYGYLDEDWEGD